MDNIEHAKHAIGQVLGNLNPNNFDTPIIGKVRKFNHEQFGTPWYAKQVNPHDKTLDPNMMSAIPVLPMGTIAINKVSPFMVDKAAKILKGRVTKDDVNTIGKFAEMVETGKAGEAFGEVGQKVQSLVDNLFGQQVGANLDNYQVKEALDMALKKALPQNF